MEMVQRKGFQRLCIPFAKVEVREAITLGNLSRHAQHGPRQVDAQDRSLGSHPRGSAKRGLPTTGREIEHVHAAPKAAQVEHPLAQRGAEPGLDGVVTVPDFFESEQRRSPSVS
jgi:hypothetical protein